MMEPQQKKEELIQEVINGCREMSTATVIFHQVIAKCGGISGADHKYLDILLRKGPMSANQLARYAGLTTGAVTGIIDRLEKMKLAKREGDPKDRRKTLIVPCKEKVHALFGPLLSPLIRENISLHHKYTVTELGFIKAYLQDITALLSANTEELVLKQTKPGATSAEEIR